MKQIFKTRLNYKPYFFILLCAVIMASVFILDLRDEGRFGTSKQILLLCLLSFLALMALYVLAKSPRVSISNQGIKIGKRNISFSEIAEIDLYSSINLSIFANTEISALKLKNGKRIRLFLENYSNGNLIRLNLHNLHQFLSGSTSHFSVTRSTPPDITYDTDLEDFLVYRQSAFKVFSYWAFFPLVIICVFMGFQITASLAGQLVLFGFALSMLFILVLQSSYFILSPNFLVVKNYLVPWWSKTFHLSAIDRVSIFTASKAPPALNLVTSNFKHYRFPSGFMSFKMYNALVAHIQENKEALTPEPEATTQL